MERSQQLSEIVSLLAFGWVSTFLVCNKTEGAGTWCVVIPRGRAGDRGALEAKAKTVQPLSLHS